MEKMEFALTGVNPNGQQFIRCQIPHWVDGLLVGAKTGFVQVKPEVAERKLRELQEGKLIASFSGTVNRQTRLFDITVKSAEAIESETGEGSEAEAANELEHR